MDVRVLRNFLVVAREQNITRAAESLHIAQPSLSKQLMDLEKELGKPLLLRGKRKLTLTEHGALLRKRAEKIVALMEKTRQEIAADAGEISGRIAIGGSPTACVLKAAAALREKHPGVHLDFYVSDATDVVERLDHGSLDFAVLLEPVDLARQAAVERADLCRAPLVFHRRAGLQMEIAHWAQTEPERLQIAATYNVVNGWPAPFVRSGLGYFLTTEDHLGAALDSDLCFRPLNPPLTIHHAMVWKHYPIFSKACEAFVACVRQADEA